MQAMFPTAPCIRMSQCWPRSRKQAQFFDPVTCGVPQFRSPHQALVARSTASSKCGVCKFSNDARRMQVSAMALMPLRM